MHELTIMVKIRVPSFEQAENVVKLIESLGIKIFDWWTTAIQE